VDADGQKVYVVLDLKVKIINVFNYIWKVLSFDINTTDNAQIQLYYRRKKKLSSLPTPQ